jgi:phospholipid/cholesterol/gamma-HCH transport system permease protein
VTRPLTGLFEELEFLAVVLMSAAALPRGEWSFLVRHVGQQVYFTAVQRATIFTVVGLIIGVLIAFPLIVFRIQDPHLLGRIMDILMYHQLNPILATLFVAGLSGAAITAELGELRANQAIEHLAAMGVDPHRFFVLPRLIGMVLSLPILVCWLNVGVTFGAAAMLSVYQDVPSTVFFRVCLAGFTLGSLALTGAMVVMQAIHVVLVQTSGAFRVGAYVDIPRTLPNAFARSFIGCLIITLLFSLVRYG